MKTKTKLSILVIVIMAVVIAGISAILLRYADNMNAEYIGRIGSSPAGQYIIGNFIVPTVTVTKGGK